MSNALSADDAPQPPKVLTTPLEISSNLRQLQRVTGFNIARAIVDDLIDRKIVAELMRDATLPVAQIADRVGLSQTPCWKRIQRLESTGVLTGRVALADPARLGFGLTVFVGIEAPDHSAEWRTAFTAAIESIPEVMDAHRMAGEMDYLLRVLVQDMAHYARFISETLLKHPSVQDCKTSFVMDRVKSTTALPV